MLHDVFVTGYIPPPHWNITGHSLWCIQSNTFAVLWCLYEGQILISVHEPGGLKVVLYIFQSSSLSRQHFYQTLFENTLLLSSAEKTCIGLLGFPEPLRLVTSTRPFRSLSGGVSSLGQLLVTLVKDPWAAMGFQSLGPSGSSWPAAVAIVATWGRGSKKWGAVLPFDRVAGSSCRRSEQLLSVRWLVSGGMVSLSLGDGGMVSFVLLEIVQPLWGHSVPLFSWVPGNIGRCWGEGWRVREAGPI